MPPKERPSKKSVQKKAEARLEDATFGLKNKNKSSKVKQFVERAEKQTKNSLGAAEALRAKELKKEVKLAKLQQEEELRLLFNDGTTDPFGRKITVESNLELDDMSDDSSSEDYDDSDDDDQDPGECVGDDSDEEDGKAGTEVFKEKTLEDIIEEQRAKLTAEGKVGTPVTEESFRKWRSLKLAQRQVKIRFKT
jgi:hypothetical protein